jgi:hypothetical protein
MTQPAFLYARYSAAEQGRGTSLKRQFENARKYAEQRGWLLDPEREISDKGRSAFHGANRSQGGALWQFERQVEKGLFRNGAVFVVEHFDRISRQGWEEVHAFLKLCVENGVSVATLDGDRYYPAGQRIDGGTIMELVFKSEGARDESAKKSKRGLDNWAFKIAAIEGGDRKTNIGLLPAWLKRGRDKEPCLHPHRVKVLQEIYELYVEGIGLPGIVRLLNARKEPTWGYGEKANASGWNTAYLNKLLKNRAVLGEYEPMSRTHQGTVESNKGLRVANHYPQAITADLFNKAQAVRESRQRTGGSEAHRISNLFSGAIFCASCGAPMYHQSQQRAGRPTNHRSKADNRKLTYVSKVDRSYLMCNNNRRSHECGNDARFRYEHLEPAILDAVLNVVIDDKRFSMPDHVAALTANVAELARLIEGKRHNLDAIVESLGEHFIKALAAKAQQMEAEIEVDERRLADMSAELRRESGAGSPQEQLQRVREVRASITADDPDVRYAARSRVKQALSQLIRINCDAEGVATVHVAAGLMAWRFDAQGQLIDSFDLRQRLDLHQGLTSGELADNAKRVEAVLVRSSIELDG